MKYWKKLSARETSIKIARALQSNINFDEHACLGIPASRLDDKLFSNGITGREPLIQVYRHNPNHIGCHTLGTSEVFFHGTQALEKELVELISVDILKADISSTDGYVASGGTEANLQAIWIYRNHYLNLGAKHHQIAIVCSEDTHYSVAKAANLLNIDLLRIPVNFQNRIIDQDHLNSIIADARDSGKKYFIVVANMGTTMFGSVDDPEVYASVFREKDLQFFIHVDGAFGGFIYPFSSPGNDCDFSNPNVSSITLDAHKMLQAPYGTGIFIVRKGLIQNVITRDAAYVNGFDLTISGSRSGANAVSVWLLLFSYGPFGWLEKINKLLYRTSWLCDQLRAINIRFYNHSRMNIVAIQAEDIDPELAHKYGLVPDNHSASPAWYKVVIMDHVDLDVLNLFLYDLKIYKSGIPASNTVKLAG